jgi:hypothetical protein
MYFLIAGRLRNDQVSDENLWMPSRESVNNRQPNEGYWRRGTDLLPLRSLSYTGGGRVSLDECLLQLWAYLGRGASCATPQTDARDQIDSL